MLDRLKMDTLNEYRRRVLTRNKNVKFTLFIVKMKPLLLSQSKASRMQKIIVGCGESNSWRSEETIHNVGFREKQGVVLEKNS